MTTPSRPTQSRPIVNRLAAEIVVALATGLAGALVVYGSLEFGVGWGDSGPEPGAFPFYVGLIIVAASLVNIAAALFADNRGEAFLDRRQAGRVMAFCLPILAFVAVGSLLGLYVATVLYLAGTMIFQGGYRAVTAVAAGLGVAAFFYLLFEIWFQVPLLKGPLEAALGL